MTWPVSPIQWGAEPTFRLRCWIPKPTVLHLCDTYKKERHMWIMNSMAHLFLWILSKCVPSYSFYHSYFLMLCPHIENGPHLLDTHTNLNISEHESELAHRSHSSSRIQELDSHWIQCSWRKLDCLNQKENLLLPWEAMIDVSKGVVRIKSNGILSSFLI